MICVFLSFVSNVDPLVKIFGVGLAVAVFLDATLVRMVLVPSTMALLGNGNWWLPRWLDRILPHLDIEGNDFEAGIGDGTAVGSTAPSAPPSTREWST